MSSNDSKASSTDPPTNITSTANKGSQPKLKPPPPRRNTNNAARDAAENELLTGPTIRSRPQRVKEEDSTPPPELIVTFAAPTREGKPKPRATGGSLEQPGSFRGNIHDNPARGFNGFHGDDAFIKEDHSMTGMLHYAPVTVPFQPPQHSLTSAWYEQFQGRIDEHALLLPQSTNNMTPTTTTSSSTISSTIAPTALLYPAPDLPAYRDPSYAAAIDPHQHSQQPTASINASSSSSSSSSPYQVKEEEFDSTSIAITTTTAAAPMTFPSASFENIYAGLPNYQNPGAEEYMVPVLHSAAHSVSYKPTITTAAPSANSSANTSTSTSTSTSMTMTMATTPTTPTTSTTSVKQEDGIENEENRLLNSLQTNENLSFIQLPPILHLSQVDPTVTGASTTDGVYVRENLPSAYNVNGATSKTEDVAKLGLLPRLRDLSYGGRVGELEIYESGAVYLVIGEQRLLLQNGPEVMMRQDLIHIKKHPFNLKQDLPTPSSITSSLSSSSSMASPGGDTASTAAASAGGVDMNVITTAEDEYILYNMGHINTHLIASIDVASMIRNAQ